MNNIKIHKFLSSMLLLFSVLLGSMNAIAEPLPVPDAGPGGPILTIKSLTSSFGDFYPEILRNEGFNAFAVVDFPDGDGDGPGRLRRRYPRSGVTVGEPGHTIY